MTAGGSAIVDLHSHVLPGVDDGAQDLDEALAALRVLAADGVVTVAATPHFRASSFERPARAAEILALFDEAHEALEREVARMRPGIEVARGSEFKLDAPEADLTDPRLRLAASRYALVEFASFMIPAFAGNQLRAVRDAGWRPVLAHAERYAGVTTALDRVKEWHDAGILLQVNARSLLGWYGPGPRAAARELLGRGWVCCLASDYHARGTPDFALVRRLMEQGRPERSAEGIAARLPGADSGAAAPGHDTGGSAGDEVETSIRLLTFENPKRILADQDPLPVPPLWVPEGGRGASRAGSAW